MPDRVLTAVGGIARLDVLPQWVRAAYALAMKRIWRVLPAPVTVDVPTVGRLRVDPGDFIDSRLFFFRVWEPEISRFIGRAARQGSVAVDIGANIGYYTLLLSRRVGGSGRVYAVEPGPEIRKRLDANLALNPAANVEVVPCGISDRAERRQFVLDQANHGASHFGDVAGEGGIELRRLVDVVAPGDLARTGLIKVDVEGMEVEVLRDLLASRDQLADDLIIVAEIRMTSAMRLLVEAYRQAGFSTFVLDNRYKMLRYASSEVADPVMSTELGDGQLDVAFVSPAALNRL